MEQPHFIQKRAASCLTMSKIIPMTRATKRERHKDHDKENEEGQLACVVTRIHQRPEPLSDVEDYTTAGHPASSVQYFLPEIMSNSKLSNRSGTVNKAQQIPQVSQFWTYAAGHGGSVEHWKKLARKAELEMHLEQEQHRFDREKDLDSIHRLRCRISALEAAAQDKDVIIEKHRRKINLLKSQLGSTSKKLGKEITPEYIQQSSVTKSPKKTWRKQSSLESDGAVQGFEDFTMPKGDSQFCAKDGSPDLLKKRPGKTTLATKILQLRTENFTLSKQLGQRDERLKSLFYEAEHLRKQNKEAISHRNSAISQVREAEKLFEKLEAMEPLIVRAGILKEQDLNTNSDDCSSFVVNKGTKSMENELRQRSKNDLASRISPSNNMETAIVPVDEIKVDVGKISRKQAFRKWASILNKIQSALMVFVSKVHTTSQLETNLKIERESFANLAYKLQKEVSTEMASQNINDTESLIGGDQIEGGRNDDRIGSDNHMVNFRVDKELVHKLVSAVREQKRKLLAASERVEVKEFTSRVVLSDPQQPIQEENQIKKLALNPLKKLALFQVDLLVNNKAHKQLEVSGTMGGLYQAAIHYFSIDPQLGEITFENGNLPGSQSSNMLAELMLLAGNAGPVYETKAGDILGLSVKVKSLNDKNPREILYNTNVIRTDEVMEAIKGQPIDNFSLWPDLVSSWKWERSANKGWALICIKWRFLFKNIFPEISEALQVLAIMQGAHS